MTYATVRAAAEHLTRVGRITPHQLAAFTALDQSLSDEQRQGFTELWRAAGSPASAGPDAWLAPALKIIREFEGCHLSAYRCPAGVWTIGWGSTTINGKAVREGDTITQAQADEQLTADAQRFHGAIVRAIPMAATLRPEQQAALVSWTYNVGVGAMQDSTLRRRLLAGDNPNTVAGEELPRWDKADGKPLAGLTRRRAAEVRLFTGGTGHQQPAKTSGVEIPAGMVGPRKAPDLKPGDHHLVADDRRQTMAAFTHDGTRLWSIPCLCRGQAGDTEWKTTGSDTPPGLYKVGRVYRDYEQDPTATFTKDRQSYGWYSFDLEGQEGQEGPNSQTGRDGIMIHGGGTACGWPGAWAPRQALHPTLGCIRLHNVDLRERVLPLVGMGTVWVSVLQEAP
jgi:GH24 family phage-related lysozyme (muramidase)